MGLPSLPLQLQLLGQLEVPDLVQGESDLELGLLPRIGDELDLVCLEHQVVHVELLLLQEPLQLLDGELQALGQG